MVDTAYGYGNQKGVARALKAARLPRDEVFISTKVPGGLTQEATVAAHEENLAELGVDSVELLLTHFPCDVNMTRCSKTYRQETWRGLEALVKAGKAKAIGVSHYCQR